MQFYTASNEQRPVRLSEEIRRWAWESQHGKYGDEAVKHWAVSMDDVPGYTELPPLQQQDIAIRRIAERAPVRICPYEQVAGAATLGLGIRHSIPATYGGKAVLSGVSHHTPNFARSLREGVGSYAAQIAVKLEDQNLAPEDRAFLESLSGLIESMRI